MSKATIKLFISSGLIFLSSVAVLVLAIWYREQSGEELIQQLSSVKNKAAMEAVETSLSAQEQLVQGDLLYLENLVLQDETETVELLSLIDGWAANNGVTVETTNLHIQAEDKGSYDKLYIDLSFSGGEDAVMKLVMLMELLPYHSAVESLTFNRFAVGSQTLAKATMQLQVSIKKSK